MGSIPRNSESAIGTQQTLGGLPLVDDWAGEDDAANPRNWSLRRRTVTTALVSGIAFVSTLAASIYTPGHDQVSKTFDVSRTVALLPLSCYNLGLAFGPCIGAPLSETFGRKVLYLTTTPIFALFVVGAGVSNNIYTLIVCRFFSGVFGSPAISNAAASISDWSSPRYRAIPLAFYYSIPFLGSVLGPLIGAFVVEGRGWRWTQWTIIFFVVTFWIPVLFVRESYKKTILGRRAKRRSTPADVQSSKLKVVKHFLTTLFLRPIHMLTTEPIVTFICLYTSFQFGLLYNFVVASPGVFESTYGFGLTAQGLSFLGFVVGCLFAPPTLIVIDHFVYQKNVAVFLASRHPDASLQAFPPEYRLYSAMIGSFLLPASLFTFAWTARSSIHWICPIFCQGLIIFSSLLIYVGGSSYMVDTYGPLYGASANGASMISRYTLSAAFPLFTVQMFGRLGTGWATSLLAFFAVGMAPIPWVFYRWGPALRARSRYERSI